MVDKPHLAIDTFNQYVDKQGSVHWPEDPKERALLARALFGRQLVASFDTWMKHAIDLLENPEPLKPFLRQNVPYDNDKYFREHLGQLHADQKLAVRTLMRELACGILFSTLVAFDQCSFGKYDIILIPSQVKDNSGISLFDNIPEELHDELNDWIISFSQYSEEILELIQDPKGWWQFKPKKY